MLSHLFYHYHAVHHGDKAGLSTSYAPGNQELHDPLDSGTYCEGLFDMKTNQGSESNCIWLPDLQGPKEYASSHESTDKPRGAHALNVNVS